MEKKNLLVGQDAVAAEDVPAYDGGIAEGERADMESIIKGMPEKRTTTGKVWGLSRGKRKPKITPQMKIFVNHLLTGKSKADAYRAAYNVRSNNAASINSSANKLICDPRIAELIQDMDSVIRERVIEDAVKTKRWVMERLHDRVMNAKSESAELKALELMGRAVAMFTDNLEQNVKQVNVQQLKDDLRAHLKLVDNVARIGGDE